MFRKMGKLIYIMLALSLLAAGAASANGSLPTWETAFDPGPYMLADPDTGELNYFVHALEEYKNNLYLVAGSPGWFQADYKAYAGRVFRSPDGKTWEPVTGLGFGFGSVEDECGTNYYDTSWDMIVFQNKLYLLPFDGCYTRPGLILRTSDGLNWETVTDTGELGLAWGTEWDLGYAYYGQFHKLSVFNDMLYADIEYYNSLEDACNARVFRSPSGDPGTWTEVVGFPYVCSPGSFQTFKGALYVATDGAYDAYWNPVSDQVWRTFDGLSWEMVANGFDNDFATLGAFADYQGYLYAGVGTYAGDGGQIWRSNDGLDWEPAMKGGFGNPSNEKIDGLGVYKGELFAYALNWFEGGSVFRTQDAINWEAASEPGWGNPSYFTTHHTSDQVVFKDEFYMGVLGPQGVLLKMLHPDK